MNDFSVGKLCFALSEVVNAMGMPAENSCRAGVGKALAYSEDAFAQSAQRIEDCGIHILQGQ